MVLRDYTLVIQSHYETTTSARHKHMRATTLLRQAVGGNRRSLNSLALSVYFKHPEFGMKDYEILSRASCFLLGVDPPEDVAEGPYAHLEENEKKRKLKEYKHKHRYSPALGGKDRDLTDMGWLEYVPRELRPQVHIVASSHVLSPFLWRDYYPQDWLSRVRQEHCVYSLEVFDPAAPDQALAKMALNPEPFHHPEGRDLALIHLKDEIESLTLLKKLGVDVLHLRDPDKLYRKGEHLTFDGFVVSEPNTTDSQNLPSAEEKKGDDEDTRIFYPYEEEGKLSFHTNDRFFASTVEPLPEGLCGAPVLDKDGDLCGTVEGIVPVTHKDKRLAGAAAFIPSYVMQPFVDYVERGLLQKMMPDDLFQTVVTAKKTNSIGGGVFKADGDGKYTTESNWEEAYSFAMERIRSKYSSEEVEAIMSTIEEERDQVLKDMDEKGGDMNEIIERVRRKTLQMREMIREQYRKEHASSQQKEECGR